MRLILQMEATDLIRQLVARHFPAPHVVDYVADADDAGFERLLPEAEGVLHVLNALSARRIALAPGLRFIQKLGVGVNTIDLDAARARAIAVANMPGANAQAVAEMTLTLMLATLRRLVDLDRATRQGAGWALPASFLARTGEIHGRKVALIGAGAVPRLLVPVLKALGARVAYWSRAPRPEMDAPFEALDDLIASADIVSLHVPLTPETQGLMNARRLAALRDGAVLINTARGGLVDQDALARDLASGRIAAGLDVFATEPLTPGEPILAAGDAVVTPHVAWLTPETLDKSLAIAAENCRRLVAGEALMFRVA